MVGLLRQAGVQLDPGPRSSVAAFAVCATTIWLRLLATGRSPRRGSSAAKAAARARQWASTAAASRPAISSRLARAPVQDSQAGGASSLLASVAASNGPPKNRR
jgi:hypothetical protein